MYGPVRTVVWQGSAGDRRPYADLADHPEVVRCWLESNAVMAASTEARHVDLLYPGRKRYGPSRVIKTAASKVASEKPTSIEP